jgi:hypothetical protein
MDLDSQHSKIILNHTPPHLFITLPFLILFLFFTIIFIVLQKFSRDSTITDNLKLIFYYMILFISMPFVCLFLLINIILITLSLLFFEKLYYISLKKVFEFIFKTCSLCKKSEVNTITIIKKPEIESQLPERANKYKEVSNESKEKIEKQQGDNLNLNKSPEVIVNIMNNSRPLNKKGKGKNFEFVNKILEDDKNRPTYVVLLNMIKNKMKNKFNTNNIVNISNVVPKV